MRRVTTTGVGRLAAAVLLHVAVLLMLPAAWARDNRASESDITLSALPREARDVLARIQDGGPFPFERDGVTFGNRERLLAAERRGFYHEYTVATPGARNRGARRIICGGPRRSPDVCYYTADHYASFRRIRE
ncbi:MAG: ribonuclease [Betaproteobacteria bacterium]